MKRVIIASSIWPSKEEILSYPFAKEARKIVEQFGTYKLYSCYYKDDKSHPDWEGIKCEIKKIPDGKTYGVSIEYDYYTKLESDKFFRVNTKDRMTRDEINDLSDKIDQAVTIINQLLDLERRYDLDDISLIYHHVIS